MKLVCDERRNGQVDTLTDVIVEIVMYTQMDKKNGFGVKWLFSKGRGTR